MISSGFDFWFWEIIVFLYFTFKNILLSKILKITPLKIHPIVSIAITIIALFINNQLVTDYAKYLSMSPVIGAVKLPPFTLLFLIADFISSIAILLLISIRIGVSFFSMPYAGSFVEFGRLLLLSATFSIIISQFWLVELSKQTNWNYHCFKNQLIIDIAVYYYHNHKLPGRLEEFTQYKINPVNDAYLLYSGDNSMNIVISDGKGNKLVEGYKDFIGLISNTDNPPNFFKLLRIENKDLCSSALKIPPEFDKDPAWMHN